MTRYYDSRRTSEPDVPVVASYNNTEHKEYICSECSRTMVHLWDSNHQSPSYFCRTCNIETRTDEMNNLRSKSRLEVPSGVNTAPYASTKFVEPDLKRKKTEVKGGLKALSETGRIKITSYKESKS